MSAIARKGDGSFLIRLHDEADVDSFVKDLRKKIKPDSDKSGITINQTNVSSSSGSGGMNNLDIVIFGDDFGKVTETAKMLTKNLAVVEELENISNNLSESKPEIVVNVDQHKAAENGLSAAQAGLAIRELLNDTAITTMLVNEISMDVRVGLQLDSVNMLEGIKKLEIPSPLGTLVKISDLAEVKEVPGPVSIYSEEGKDAAKVTAKITEKNTGAVSGEVQTIIDAMDVSPGVNIRMGGVTEIMRDTFRDLIYAMIIAVFAVFFVMLIALGEAIAPLAILFSLPLAAIGGFIALFVAKLPLDMPSMIGALMLIGIVVTNAIVLIDRVQQRRREGMPVREALLEAGRIRMRPILMTAIATIAALIPLAMGISKGSILSQSLAVIVIGGLTTSTFLTLVIVPVAYEMLESLKLKILGVKE
jgi:HAE1 family hydrophobic/amphiphilic exporter-1